MEIHQATIPYDSRADMFRLVPIGDIHAGARSCKEKMLDDLIEDIADDPNARWVGLGDWGDFINLRDPRFDWSSLAPWVLERLGRTALSGREKDAASLTVAGIQRDWLQKKFEPIKDKGIGIMYGNHEDAIRIKWENDTAVAMADRLGLPCLGYSCYLRLLFGRGGGRGSMQSLILFLHHGYFSSRLAGGSALALERMFGEHPQAQVIVVAHGHRRTVVPSASYDVNWQAKKNQIEEIEKYAIMTGAFVAPYSQPGVPASWSERKGFRLQQSGPVEIIYRPDKRKLSIVA